MTLLDKIIKVLPAAQKMAIKNLIARKKKLGYIRTSREEIREAEALYKSIQGNLGNKVYDPTYAIPGSKISSEEHNKNMEGIFIDINALYQQIHSLGSSDSSKTASLNSDYFKSKAAIEKLINDARTYALRKKYKDFSEIQIIDFNSARNVTNSYPKASIDEKTRNLELKPITSTRAQLQNRGSRYTKIYTKTIGPGIKGSLSSSFPPELMIDQRPETFWGSLVLSDAPVVQTYSKGASEELTINGPVVEIYLQFSHIEPINVIRLLPFGEYPIDIIDISYKPSISSEIYYSIKGFDTDPSLDWTEINFNKIFASEIRITISQENAKLISYQIPKSTIVNTDLFDYIFQERAQSVIGANEFDSDLAKSINNLTNLYEEALEDLDQILSLADLEKSSVTEIELNIDSLTALGLVLKNIDPGLAQQLIQSTITKNSNEEEIVDIKKYEYILGVRDIETAYEQYAPYCYFKSEEYLPQATLSEVQIEVDQENLLQKSSWGEYYSSSTEWEIDLGEGRVIPIHPINQTGEYGLPATNDEYLTFSRVDHKAYTRLGSKRATPLSIKKNGIPMPLTGAYSVTRETGSIPRLKIELKDSWFDENSIYTIDYEVSPGSYSLDILSSLKPRSLVSPEIYKGLGSDKDIILKHYPFVDYEVINRGSLFSKYEDRATWFYDSPVENIATGHVKVWPTITNSIGEVQTSGSITGYTISGNWGERSGSSPLNIQNTVSGEYLADPFGYYMQIQEVNKTVEISGTFGTTGFLFVSPPSYTLDQLKQMPANATSNMDLTGSIPSGYLEAEYVLGVGININDNVYVFDNNEYTPIKVLVGGKEAKNISDYETLEHPAFSVANNNDLEYQYIHAGRKLYFNQDITLQEISTDYSWLTQYVSVVGVLRCNKVVKLDTTPKVEEVRLLMNTSIL